MSTGLVGVPWLVCAVVAFGGAAVFSFVTPGSSVATGLQYVVVRWLHALAWLMLGLAALARGLLLAQGSAERVAQIALGVYGGYLFTFTRAQRRSRRG